MVEIFTQNGREVKRRLAIGFLIDMFSNSSRVEPESTGWVPAVSKGHEALVILRRVRP